MPVPRRSTEPGRPRHRLSTQVGLLYYVIECQSIVGKGKKDLLGFSQMDGLRGDAGMGRYDRNYFSRKLLN